MDALTQSLIQTQLTESTEDTECIVAVLTYPQPTNKDGEKNATLADKQGMDTELFCILVKGLCQMMRNQQGN